MGVMKSLRSTCKALGWGLLAILAMHGMIWAQDSPKEGRLLFLEDFEKYPLGSTAIDGREPELETNPHRNVGTSVESQAGEANLGSKQLVVNEGSFHWETKEIVLDEPILTTVSLNVTAIAGSGGFGENDRVRVYASMEDQQVAPQPLIDLSLAEAVPANEGREFLAHLPMGALAEAVWDNDYEPREGVRGGRVGVLNRSQMLRLVMQVQSSGVNSYVALDDLTVSESAFDGLENPSAWEDAAFDNVRFNVPEGASLDPDIPSQEISASSVQDELAVNITDLHEGEIYLGTVNPVETQRWHPVRNARFGSGRFGDEALLFTMDRPEEGWESVTYWPGLFIREEGAPPRRIDRLARVGRWIFPPYEVEGHLGEIVLEPESAAPIEGDEPWVDFTVRIDAEQPYPVDRLEETEVYATLGFIGGRVKAEFLGVTEMLDEGRLLRLAYRLSRPSYGWPTDKVQIDIYGPIHKVGGNGVDNFLRVAPGRSKVSVVIPPSDVVPPGKEGPASNHAQFVLASQDRFTINVDYLSDDSIDLSTLGDGDVLLDGQTMQPGQLIAVQSSEDDRKVRATFEFRRDPYAYRNRGYVSFDMPSGAVSNVAGGTSIGLDLLNFDNPRFANIDVLEQAEPDVTPVFVSLGSLDPALESYRFGVNYQTSEAGLNLEDFEQAHLTLTPENTGPPNLFTRERGVRFTQEWLPLVPETISKRSLPDGRGVAVDYRIDKPADGWPFALRIKTLRAGIRDLNGRGLGEREVAVVGRNDLMPMNAQLIGGEQIVGDPDTHRLSLLVQVSPRWKPLWLDAGFFGPDFGTFEGTIPVMGWDREMLPHLEDDEAHPPPVAGRFVSVRQSGYQDASPKFDFTGIKTIVNVEIDRPDGGWDQWDRSRVPYVIQAPGLTLVPSSVIASGFLSLSNAPDALPLLFSFEEWVKQLEERADLPEGSLKHDADGDGQDGLTEFALGSDLLDPQEIAAIEPERVIEEGQPYTMLKFNVRTNALGLTAELQRSDDGQDWRSADDDFRVMERTPIGEGVVRLCLLSKAPITGSKQFFRIVVAQS